MTINEVATHAPMILAAFSFSYCMMFPSAGVKMSRKSKSLRVPSVWNC